MTNPPQTIAYPVKFDSQTECEDYGSGYAARMEDWVRGNIKAPFEFPVRVGFKCQQDERPA